MTHIGFAVVSLTLLAAFAFYVYRLGYHSGRAQGVADASRMLASARKRP